MKSADNVTIKAIEQNKAFVNIKAFLDCDKQNVLSPLLDEYLPDIARMVKTYHIKYKISLDEIIAEALFAFAERMGNYPDTSRFESYSKENACKFIRRHIIKYC